jgi:hypothetical protein
MRHGGGAHSASLAGSCTSSLEDSEPDSVPVYIRLSEPECQCLSQDSEGLDSDFCHWQLCQSRSVEGEDDTTGILNRQAARIRPYGLVYLHDCTQQCHTALLDIARARDKTVTLSCQLEPRLGGFKS